MKKIILLLTFMIYSYPFSVLAQWELRYPPQITYALNDMCFLNSQVGFGVNAYGSILKTTDSGLHWKIVEHFQRDMLSEIKFIDEQNGYCVSPHSFIGDNADFVFTTDAGISWQKTYIGISNALTFHPLSKSNLIKSEDQGTISQLDNFFGLWTERYTIPQYFEWDIYVPYGDIKQFEKLDSGRILALGTSWRAFQANIIQDSVTFILFSDDNGFSWDTVWCDLAKIMPTFSFFNNQIGWLAGSENEIYKTINGGINWQLIYSEDNPDVTSTITKIKAVDTLTVFAVTNKGKIISTTDGGVLWDTSSVIQNSYYDSYFKIVLIDNKTGLVFGPDLWLTTNSGKNWNKVDNSIKPSFSKIQFLNTNIGFGIGGENYWGGSNFYKTIDGGYSWNKLYSGDPNSAFNGFFMLDSLIGWLTEFNTLFKTLDGGTTWTPVYVDTLLEFIRGVEFFSSDFGVLFEVRQRFNDFALNYVTIDSGKTWQKYKMGDEPFLTSFLKIKRTDPSHIWVVNQQGVWLSRDSARSWSNISNDVEGWAGAFDFIDSLNGWAAHLDGRQDKVKFTTDGGLTWSTVMKPYMIQSQDLIIDGRDYFGRLNITVAGLNGSILRFEEGWLNAYQEESYTNDWLMSISAIREDNRVHKWIAGTGGIVLYKNDYITDVKESVVPSTNGFELHQNYPNPFNPSTRIQYQVSSISHITLKVYDMLGNEVETLVDEYKPAGSYEVEFQSSAGNRQLANGVYIYTLRAGDYFTSRKMLLLK